MRTIFSKLLYETEEGHDLMLVTVVADRGSAPRGAGAAMLVGERGRILGTIGGGAVEYRSEQYALTLLSEKRSALREFTLRPNAAEDIGMQCGGDVTVLFSYVPADDLRWSLVAGAVCDRIESGCGGWLISPLTGEVPSLYAPEGLLAGEGVPGDAKELCLGGAVNRRGYYSEPLPIPGRVVIFGGGHIAQSLVPLLGTVDFRAVVLDNRPEYAAKELFPQADEVVCCEYEHIPDYVTLTGEDYVIIMTNGHAHDLTVEAQALRLPHAYLGVVGSRRKIAVVNEKLRALGIPEETIASVHTPIGVDIRAVTPAEIAVSILGELILCRAENREGADGGEHPCPMQG